MKILKLITGLILVCLFQISFAAQTKDDSFTIYVTNELSHPLHFVNSLYSTIPVTFDVDTLPANSPRTKIFTFSSGSIGFLIQIDDELGESTPLLLIDQSHEEIIRLYGCLHNQLDQCFIVNFGMPSPTGDLDFTLTPFTPPTLKAELKKKLQAHWNRYPNVHFDFDKNRLTITK